MKKERKLTSLDTGRTYTRETAGQNSPYSPNFIRRRVVAGGVALIALGGTVFGLSKLMHDKRNFDCSPVGQASPRTAESVIQFSNRVFRENGIPPESRSFEQQIDDAACNDEPFSALKGPRTVFVATPKEE